MTGTESAGWHGEEEQTGHWLVVFGLRILMMLQQTTGTAVAARGSWTEASPTLTMMTTTRAISVNSSLQMRQP